MFKVPSQCMQWSTCLASCPNGDWHVQRNLFPCCQNCLNLASKTCFTRMYICWLWSSSKCFCLVNVPVKHEKSCQALRRKSQKGAPYATLSPLLQGARGRDERTVCKARMYPQVIAISSIYFVAGCGAGQKHCGAESAETQKHSLWTESLVLSGCRIYYTSMYKRCDIEEIRYLGYMIHI